MERSAFIAGKIKNNIYLILVILWGLSGCATPYATEGLLGGYSDSHIGNDQFHITVQGNGYTNTGMIEQYFYRRAADIAKENGYATYKVISFKASMEPWGLRCCFPVATGVILGLREEMKRFPDDLLTTGLQLGLDSLSAVTGQYS